MENEKTKNLIYLSPKNEAANKDLNLANWSSFKVTILVGGEGV